MEVKFLIAILAGIVLSAYLYQRMTNWKHVRRRDSAKRVAKRIAQIHESGQIFAYLRKIDPFVFEELLLDAFEACEIKVIRNQRYTGDGGVDGHIFFDGHVIPIQAKRYRQHISLEQVPDILVGLSESPCSFAILIETGANSPIKPQQQNGLPQTPKPPSCFASSRTPICRSSILARNTLARSLTRSLKSTLPSAVK